ncbi:MAG: DDE-type integrase/transposase/recombinase [Deinococcota bacterium]
MTAQEASQIFGVSDSTVRRATRKGVYKERVTESREGRGATTKTFFAPDELAQALGKPVEVHLVKKSSLGQVHLVTPAELVEFDQVNSKREGQGEEGVVNTTETSSLTHLAQRENNEKAIKTGRTTDPALLINPDEAAARYQQLRPLLALPEGSRRAAAEHLATKEGVSLTTIYRWLELTEKNGHLALGRPHRDDRGRLRIPPETQKIIVAALTANTAATSTRMIHRALARAVPELMTYERSGKQATVSVSTLHRIRQRLLDDPYTRLLFYDDTARKEHIRSYAGEVIALHANELWQMDMTRCDVLVVDVVSGKIFRPRIHALIDVYSGCIPGLAFSLEENQTQTDLAILRALVPKPAPYVDAWPVYGTPKRLYWDNGKTYTSEHSRRVLSELGVELVWSRPRVSHTRGKIERFFGTLHNFEKSLPGYVGENAVKRSSEHLRRIEKNTKRWLGRELTRDPGYGERLMTLHEYEQAAMDWLMAEYHEMKGSTTATQSRVDHYLESVREHPHTQRLYDYHELILTFAQRQTRKVAPDGSIRIQNQFWTLESGELINHVNRDVLVLTNQFAQATEHILAWQDRGGGLNILGAAVLMPERADSMEARNQRHASKAAAQAAQRNAKQLAKKLADPSLIISNTLREEASAKLNVAPLPQPERPTAHLAAANPTPTPEIPDDDITRMIRALDDYGTDDPKEIMRLSRERYRRIHERKP